MSSMVEPQIETPAFSIDGVEEEQNIENKKETEIEQKPETNFFNEQQQTEAVTELSKALIYSTETPELQELSKKFEQLGDQQTELIDSIQQENQRLNNFEEYKKLEILFANLPSYITKAKQIKLDMLEISTTVDKLKLKTNKLEVKKGKSDKQGLEKYNKLLERERQLTAQPAEFLSQTIISENQDDNNLSNNQDNDVPNNQEKIEL